MLKCLTYAGRFPVGANKNPDRQALKNKTKPKGVPITAQW